MNADQNQMNSKKSAQPKKQSLIRWNALISFSILIILIGLYFKLFFDSHMRSGIEWAGFKALGAEVNLSQLKSSFINGHVELNDLALTSSENPNYNSIEIASIRFDLNWDALLRLKFVIEEMAVENIQFQSKRPYPGKLAPPKPPATGPSLTDQLKGKALDKVASQNESNLLGNLSGFLKTGDYKQELKNIESELKSKKLAEDLKLKWATKQKDWDARIKTLPNDKEFKDFKVKFEAIKFKDFKTPQEVDQSIKSFNSLKKEADEKIKLVNETKKLLTEDLSALKQDYQSLDAQIKEDIASIKTRLKIPKIDANQIAKSIFMDYLTPYINKLDKVNELAEKYLPPKYSKLVKSKLNSKALLSGQKNSKDDSETLAQSEDDTIQPRPRDQGVSYEFPITKGYPLFWIQKIKISSKSNAQTDYGDLSGLITDIVSNQRQIGKQTELKISGDLKSKNILGLNIEGFLNNLGSDPKAGFTFNVASYPLNKIVLVSSPDGNIEIPQANLNLNLSALTTGFSFYELKLVNNFNNVNFTVSAKEKIVNELLQNTFSAIQQFDLKASAQGELKSLDLDVSSSIGDKLQNALSAAVETKLKEVNLEIQKRIDSEVGKLKLELDKQLQVFTKGYVGSTQDVENGLISQKSVIDEKINVAKKDFENKAKSKVKEEGKKLLDGLKGKLKF